MITRVVVRDFQSLKDVDIELGPLTVVVGANRSGKSALLRAIRAALTNETGTTFIRTGARQCEVTLHFSDREPLTWRKYKTGGAEYEIGERLFTKLGTGIPDEIIEHTNIREIKVDKDLTLAPQLHVQMKDPFLLDLTAGQAARAIAKMTKLDVVVKAQQAARTELRTYQADLREEKHNIDDLTEQLKASEFKGLQDRRVNLARVEEALHFVKQDYERSWTLQALLSAHDNAERDLSEVTVPDIGDASLIEDLKRVGTAYFSYRKAKTEAAACEVADYDLPALASDIQVLGVLKRYAAAEHEASLAAHEVESHARTLTTIEQQLAELKVCPTCGQALL